MKEAVCLLFVLRLTVVSNVLQNEHDDSQHSRTPLTRLLHSSFRDPISDLVRVAAKQRQDRIFLPSNLTTNCHGIKSVVKNFPPQRGLGRDPHDRCPAWMFATRRLRKDTPPYYAGSFPEMPRHPLTLHR